MSDVRCVLDARALLGECPRWDEPTGLLYWVDIDGCRLHCFDPGSGRNRTFQLDEEVGCLALRQCGGLVLATRSGFWTMDESDNLTALPSPEYDRATVRFNDGRCDARGRFWAGTLYQPKDHKNGWLYCLDRDGSVTRKAGPVLTANGLAFSPDFTRLYWADTPEHAIYVYDFDLDTATLGMQQLFHRFPHGQGRPDGAAVDSEGFYWSALYAGGRVVRLNPAGEIVREIPVPAKYPTMIAFGGPELKTLYITTARKPCSAEELEQHPQSGGVFAVEVEVAGLPEQRFGG